MFSDHMPKMARFPQAGLLMAAGGLVIVCQLVAMAMVADRQVQRASVRDLQQLAQRVALNDCIQRSTGPTRHSCIQQSQLESDGPRLALAGQTTNEIFAIRAVAIEGEAVATSSADIMSVGIAGTQ